MLTRTSRLLLAATTVLSSSAFAQDLIPPKSYVLTPGGVNVADGSFTHVVTDLSVGPLKVERYHRTGSKEPDNVTPLDHWRDNFDIYVVATPKYFASGGVEYYMPVVHIGNSASGVYSQTPGTLSSIYNWNDDSRTGILEWSGANSWTGGNYVYTDKSGTVYTFSRTVSVAAQPNNSHSRRVSRIDFPDGRFQTFSYSGNALKFVEDSSGYAILYDGSSVCGFNRAVTYVTSSSTCAGAALKVSYTATSNSFQVLDLNGQTTTYTMALGGATCVKPPGYSSCKVANEYMPHTSTQYVVSKQTLAGGSVWQFARQDYTGAKLNSPDAPAPHDGHNELSVTDPAGKQMAFTFTKTSPFTMEDANGNGSTFLYKGGTYTFDTSGAPLSEGTYLMEASFPEGNKYFGEYNGPYGSVTKETLKAKPGSPLNDQVVQFGYGSCSSPGTRQNCGKPIWVKDAKLNQTDFTYAGHGGLLSEMKPAPSTGAARPLSLKTWVQKYAYVKNSGGTLVQAASPVWVLDTESSCQTAAGSSSPVCDNAAPKRVTSYQYGANGTANNLLVRGTVVTADGVSRRTCAAYDSRGNRISQTSARAGLASCP